MKKWRLQSDKGQSLVELAITMPLLLVMFVGLFEVGYALRNFMVVVNANREGTRFAARGQWFDNDQEVQEIFKRVVAAAGIEQRDGQEVTFLRTDMIGDLPANTTLAVTYIEVPDQVEGGGMKVEPPIISGPWYTGTSHFGESRIDAAAIAEAARQENYEFNEQYHLTERILDIPSEDNFVIIELWYDHRQLLGLPIFTEILPDTFTLYAQSRMRVTTTAARD
jgi:hypothetical protein